MEIKKVNLDRDVLSSSYIENKQNFNSVLNNAKIVKKPMWKSPLFYGAIGLSSVAIIAISLSENELKPTSNEKKITLKPNVSNSNPANHKSFTAVNLKTQTTLTVSNSNQTSKVEAKVQKKNSTKNFVAETLEPVINPDKIEVEQVHSPIDLVPQKTAVKSIGFPSINGISRGNISLDNLSSAKVIDSNSGFDITSYEIQYYNGREDVLVQIRGNKIPDDIRAQIMDFNIGQMIFFTDIRGLDQNGKIWKLPSMNLKLVP